MGIENQNDELGGLTPFLGIENQNDELGGLTPFSPFLKTKRIIASIVIGLSVFEGSLCFADEYGAAAEKILKTAGVKGGMVVHLGAGDGRLTAALHLNARYTVQGLEADSRLVAQAREEILEKGLYGPVSIEQFDGRRLPYADNVINMVVASKCGAVKRDEILRMLAPGGVLMARERDGYVKTVKPVPDDIDDWGHFLHDAGNNAVAEDTIVGPPKHLQWLAPPLWLRSHETPSGIQSLVSSGGRVFYILDEGLIGIVDSRLPSRWVLVCRDAFNGKLLWKRPLKGWGWRAWKKARRKMEGKDLTLVRGLRRKVPNENQWRLVAQGDKVYATLGYKAPLSILNAATGETLATVEGTEWTSSVRVDGSLGLAYVEDMPASVAERRGDATSVLLAFDTESGGRLWEKPFNFKIPALLWGIDKGRIFFPSENGALICLNIRDGSKLWKRQTEGGVRELVACDGVVLVKAGNKITAYSAANGKELWRKKNVYHSYRKAMFVIDGAVYPGATRGGTRTDTEAEGFDIHTGKLKKKVLAKNLVSPEHHHRCYRNKATSRYIITSMEGAEFLDLIGDNHSQNNWVRGACVYGMMPCNGLLYAPPDQCFCSPGSMLRGFAALSAENQEKGTDSNPSRLKRGRGYGKTSNAGSKLSKVPAWPTYRHDSERSGSTSASVPANVKTAWRTQLNGKLTAPVAAEGMVYVAESDAHTLYALDAESGRQLWHFTAGGRIDSPPTIYDGLVLFGSKDGKVYCLRATDGELVWRFRAAESECMIGSYGQLESAWPVHGSVLVENGIVYFAAGRSTYLDGGIYFYGLDPESGKVVHEGHLGKPPLGVRGVRDKSFYTLGANSDVLVSEGGYIYMRQKKLDLNLNEIEGQELSSKGEMDVGLHIFSTAGLLDGSWYNRTFWMYSKRWPGFQLANQAPKSGQLLVKDENKTYTVKVFYRRNVHSPMFFPGKEGYLLFADSNSNEPQIVGEKGAVEPRKWLPQSGYSRANRKKPIELDSKAFGKDKLMGYTRATPPLWKSWMPIRIRAMVKAGDLLFVAGPPDVFDSEDPFGAFEGRKGGWLAAVSSSDGQKLSELKLDSPPVFDGMIAVQGRLFASLRNGAVVCFAAERQ